METPYGLLEELPQGIHSRGLLAVSILPLILGISASGFWLLILGLGLLLPGILIVVLRTYWKYQTSPQKPLGLQPAGPCSLLTAAGNDDSEASSRALIGQLFAARDAEQRRAITAPLVEFGEPLLPLLREAFAQETDERHLQQLAQVCGQLALPAARQLLLEVAQAAHLPGRAAALRALGSYETVSTDAPLFHRLLGEEMQLAQQLVHGMLPADEELRAALRYELRRGQQRLYGLLLQVYERAPILLARRTAAHTTGPRQAQALAGLPELISRPLYRGLQALLDGTPLPDQVQTLADLLGPFHSAEAIQTTIVRRGEAAFSAWTISVALSQWHAQPPTVEYLYPHLQSDNALVQESAVAVLRQLPMQRPAAHDQLVALFPSAALLMVTSPPTACVPVRERVLMLKGTALFAETPENTLATIVPIMQEVAFAADQEIFVKDSLGTSLFIVCEGEVRVFDGEQQLAVFRKGDFFGELALLDAEPRSATAVAHGPVVTFRLDQEDFYEVMEEHREVLRNILRVLCQRLRRQNEKGQAPAPNKQDNKVPGR